GAAQSQWSAPAESECCCPAAWLHVRARTPNERDVRLPSSTRAAPERARPHLGTVGRGDAPSGNGTLPPRPSKAGSRADPGRSDLFRVHAWLPVAAFPWALCDGVWLGSV